MSDNTATAGAGLSPRGRFVWLDVARGVALLAMAVYHFVWDLALFGLVDPFTPFALHWVALARGTATTFLLLVGLGLVIGHGKSIRWTPFWRRFAMIAGAAGLITAATLFAFPDAFIFFGILHMIAAGSLAGLLLVRAPAWVALAAAIATLVIWWFGASAVFDAPWAWWTGLGTLPIRSNDFVPFFPAFAAVALGIAAGRTAKLHVRNPTIEASRTTGPVGNTFALAGRHSLLVYLAHQPILIGLIWVYVQLRV